MMLEIPEIDKKLLVNSAIFPDGKVPDDFKCAICFNFVYDPQMCLQCGNALYCNMCLDYNTDVVCQCGR